MHIHTHRQNVLKSPICMHAKDSLEGLAGKPGEEGPVSVTCIYAYMNKMSQPDIHEQSVSNSTVNAG